MEVSSDHFVNWHRTPSGGLVATGQKPPDQSYKPLIPNPDSLAPSNKTGPISLGAAQPGLNSEIAGNWDITVDDGDGDLIRYSVHIEPSGEVSHHCASVKYTTSLGIRLNNGREQGECNDFFNQLFAMNLGPPPGKGACENYPHFAPNRYRPIRFATIGPGLYEDKQEHFFACDPNDDQRKMQVFRVQVSGNSLTGIETDLGIRGHCNPDCDNAPQRISGTRSGQLE